MDILAKSGTINPHTSTLEVQNGERTKVLTVGIISVEILMVKVILCGVILPTQKRDGNTVIQNQRTVQLVILDLKIHYQE